MSMNTECPKCESENAYFDGVNYVCPDCGYEWEEDDVLFLEEDDDDDDDDDDILRF